MSGFYPDGVTQDSFDAYWNEKLDDPEEEDEPGECNHGVLLRDRCGDCEYEDYLSGRYDEPEPDETITD
jgi:MoaA/NifB/PqqE/SkfB family radical SAM enzyme